jgi:hypothetical protein
MAALRRMDPDFRQDDVRIIRPNKPRSDANIVTSAQQERHQDVTKQ